MNAHSTITDPVHYSHVWVCSGNFYKSRQNGESPQTLCFTLMCAFALLLWKGHTKLSREEKVKESEKEAEKKMQRRGTSALSL